MSLSIDSVTLKNMIKINKQPKYTACSLKVSLKTEILSHSVSCSFNFCLFAGISAILCFVKNFQKCGVSSFFLINISSYLLSDSYMQHYLQIRIYNTPQISPSLSSYIYSHDKTPDDTS